MIKIYICSSPLQQQTFSVTHDSSFDSRTGAESIHDEDSTKSVNEAHVRLRLRTPFSSEDEEGSSASLEGVAHDE